MNPFNNIISKMSSLLTESKGTVAIVDEAKVQQKKARSALLNDLLRTKEFVQEKFTGEYHYGRHFDDRTWRNVLKQILSDFVPTFEACGDEQCRTELEEIVTIILQTKSFYEWVKKSGKLEEFVKEKHFLMLTELLKKASLLPSLREVVMKSYSRFAKAIYDRRLRQVNDAANEAVYAIRNPHVASRWLSKDVRLPSDWTYVPMTDDLLRFSSMFVESQTEVKRSELEFGIMRLMIKQYYETCNDPIFNEIMTFDDVVDALKDQNDEMKYYVLREKDKYHSHFLNPSGRFITWLCEKYITTKEAIAFLNSLRDFLWDTAWFERMWKTFFSDCHDQVFKTLRELYRNQEEYPIVFTLDDFADFAVNCGEDWWRDLLLRRLKVDDNEDEDIAQKFYRNLSDATLLKFSKDSYAEKFHNQFLFGDVDFRNRVAELTMKNGILFRIYELVGCRRESYRKEYKEPFIDPALVYERLTSEKVSTEEAKFLLIKWYLTNLPESNDIDVLDTLIGVVMDDVYDKKKYQICLFERMNHPANYWISQVADFVLHQEKYEGTTSHDRKRKMDIDEESRPQKLRCLEDGSSSPVFDEKLPTSVAPVMTVELFNSILEKSPTLRERILEHQSDFLNLASLVTRDISILHFEPRLDDANIPLRDRLTSFNSLVAMLGKYYHDGANINLRTLLDVKEYAILLHSIRNLLKTDDNYVSTKRVEIFVALKKMKRFLDEHSIPWNFDEHFKNFVVGAEDGHYFSERYHYQYRQLVRKTEDGFFVCKKGVYLRAETEHGLIVSSTEGTKLIYLLDEDYYPKSFIYLRDRHGSDNGTNIFIESKGLGPLPHSVSACGDNCPEYMDLKTGHVFKIKYVFPETEKKHARYLIDYLIKDGKLLGRHYCSTFYNLEFDFQAIEKESKYSVEKYKYTVDTLVFTLKDIALDFSSIRDSGNFFFCNDLLVYYTTNFRTYCAFYNSETLEIKKNEDGSSQNYSAKGFKKTEDCFMALLEDDKKGFGPYELRIIRPDGETSNNQVSIRWSNTDPIWKYYFVVKKEDDLLIYMLNRIGAGIIFSLNQRKAIERVYFPLEPENERYSSSTRFCQVLRDANGHLWFQVDYCKSEYYSIEDKIKFEPQETLDSEKYHYDFLSYKL